MVDFDVSNFKYLSAMPYAKNKSKGMAGGYNPKLL
jgi:hypothetical protein